MVDLRGTGEDDGQGFVPFSRLPHVVNPPGGIIFNWNNKPAGDWRNDDVPSRGVAYHISNIRIQCSSGTDAGYNLRRCERGPDLSGCLPALPYRRA